MAVQMEKEACSNEGCRLRRKLSEMRQGREIYELWMPLIPYAFALLQGFMLNITFHFIFLPPSQQPSYIGKLLSLGTT